MLFFPKQGEYPELVLDEVESGVVRLHAEFTKQHAGSWLALDYLFGWNLQI